MKFIVERLDTNPENLTFGTWVHIASFKTEEEARDYVKRAASKTQILTYRREG